MNHLLTFSKVNKQKGILFFYPVTLCLQFVWIDELKKEELKCKQQNGQTKANRKIKEKMKT